MSLATQPRNSEPQAKLHATHGFHSETYGERAFNKVKSVFSRAIFWGLVLCGKTMQINDKPAIVFAPHQDDETFGCGGLIALKRERGVRVKVVILTDGAAEAATGSGRTNREQITRMRNEEVVAAALALGLRREDLEFLSLPDGGLCNLSDAEWIHAVDRVAALLAAFQPGEVYVTHRRDRHKDHEAAYRMILAAIRHSGLSVDLLQYPIWLVWFSGLGLRLRRSDVAGALVLPIHRVCQRKRNAIGAFCSQLGALPSGSVDRFYTPYEFFFRTQISAPDQPGT